MRQETSCGCAGCYTAFAATELYAEAFERAGRLDLLEPFLCEWGARFYGLAPNAEERPRLRQRLQRAQWTVPAVYPLALPASSGSGSGSSSSSSSSGSGSGEGKSAEDAAQVVVPLRAGETLAWRLALRAAIPAAKSEQHPAAAGAGASEGASQGTANK